MIENQVSLTALLCAYFRAYHAMHDTPKILDDFLAYHLIPQENRALIEQGFTKYLQLNNDPESAGTRSNQAATLATIMQVMGLPNVLGRTRYTEDYLCNAVKQGVEQYVILGAGMDTFAFRCPDILDRLHVFEIDHPNTQTFKRHRLAELDWELPKNLYFVPVDFTQESLATALKRSSYDPRKVSFFSWLGVTMYLTQDEVFATLRSIIDVASAGSMVVFDYFDTEAFIPDKTPPHMQEMREKLRQIGEPMKTGFDPSTLAIDLASLGFRLHENLSPSDIQKRYFLGRKDGYYAQELVHFARAVIE
jgi:methyltransferase (TIGR00027 family)